MDTKDSAKGCAWYIDSEIDNYCFWTWVRRVSDADGFMEPLIQQDISQLLDYSSSKIHASYKTGIEKLKSQPEFQALEALITD